VGTPPNLPQVESDQILPSAQVAHTNNLAAISLGVGISSLFLHAIAFGSLAFITSLAAVIAGHIAHRQVKLTGEQGKNLATAGLIIGYAHMAVIALTTALWLTLILAMSTH
jgi:Domain of unknown function (DUF4190)